MGLSPGAVASRGPQWGGQAPALADSPAGSRGAGVIAANTGPAQPSPWPPTFSHPHPLKKTGRLLPHTPGRETEAQSGWVTCPNPWGRHRPRAQPGRVPVASWGSPAPGLSAEGRSPEGPHGVSRGSGEDDPETAALALGRRGQESPGTCARVRVRPQEGPALTPSVPEATGTRRQVSKC